MKTIKKTYYSINIAMFVTLFISAFWGMFFFAPNYVKAIFSVGMWCSFLLLPYGKLLQNSDFSRFTKVLLVFISLIICIQILRSVFNTDEDMYILGNKWTTLFGNEYTALAMLPPLFIFVGTLPYSVKILKNATWIFLCIGAVLSLAMKYPLASISIFACVFYPYVDKKYKYLLILAIIEAFFLAMRPNNGVRMFFIVIAFTIAAYTLVFVLKKSIYTKIFVVFIAILPLFLFIPLFFHFNKSLTSFEQAQEIMSSNSEYESLGLDTRSFLYSEMVEDLNETGSWLMGKGAYSHYYSLVFDDNIKGRYGRISSEVPILTFMLRGGILYTVTYYCLLLFAVYNAIWRSCNKMIKTAGIIIVGWYFNSFVGDITGCRFYHLAFFLLVGCCLSKKWLNYTDNDIKKIME